MPQQTHDRVGRAAAFVRLAFRDGAAVVGGGGGGAVVVGAAVVGGGGGAVVVDGVVLVVDVVVLVVAGVSMSSQRTSPDGADAMQPTAPKQSAATTAAGACLIFMRNSA